jgi:hypothetical protein
VWLENSVSQTGTPGRFLQVGGLCFTYNKSLSVGSRVLSAVRQTATGCNGAAVSFAASASYTVAANDFITTGGAETQCLACLS